LDNLNTIGGIIIASTSENGEKIIKKEISSIAEELNKLFDGKLKLYMSTDLNYFFFFFCLDISAQKDNLHAIHTHWREYKDEYEKLSDWLQQIDISMKAIKNTPLATVLEKTDQVKQIQV
jgi:nesprin-1